jgi:hypothetical protein
MRMVRKRTPYLDPEDLMTGFLESVRNVARHNNTQYGTASTFLFQVCGQALLFSTSVRATFSHLFSFSLENLRRSKANE